MAIQILDQKSLCQQDPDQDEADEAPEDSAEYDSILISAAGDLVASLANALGRDFASAFPTFFKLISKYYVRPFSYSSVVYKCQPNFIYRKRRGHSATGLLLSVLYLRSLLA